MMLNDILSFSAKIYCEQSFHWCRGGRYAEIFSASLANLGNLVWYSLHASIGLAVEGRTDIFKYCSISIVDGEGDMEGLVEIHLAPLVWWRS